MTTLKSNPQTKKATHKIFVKTSQCFPGVGKQASKTGGEGGVFCLFA